jgi:hypothetical protein
MKKLIKKILVYVSLGFVLIACVSGILLNSVDKKIVGNVYEVEMTSGGNIEPLYAQMEIDDSFNGYFELMYAGDVQNSIYALEIINGANVYAKTPTYGIQYLGKISAYEFVTSVAVSSSQYINLKMVCKTNVTYRTALNCLIYIPLILALGAIAYLAYEPVNKFIEYKRGGKKVSVTEKENEESEVTEIEE